MKHRKNINGYPIPPIKNWKCGTCDGYGYTVWDPMGYAERDRCEVCKGTGRYVSKKK